MFLNNTEKHLIFLPTTTSFSTKALIKSKFASCFKVSALKNKNSTIILYWGVHKQIINEGG